MILLKFHQKNFYKINHVAFYLKIKIVKTSNLDNDYLTFPYKILVDKCVGSCNDVENPYFKVSLPGSIKNISVKSFDLLSQKNVLKNISFHKSCKSGCLLDEKVCNNKQKWNNKKRRCECKEKKV